MARPVRFPRHIWFKIAHAGGAGGDKEGRGDRLGDAADDGDDDSDDPVVGNLLGDDDDDEDDDDDGWNKLPIITFQTFDDLTSGTATTASTKHLSPLPDTHPLTD